LRKLLRFKSTIRCSLLLLAIGTNTALASAPKQKLVVVGGGSRPEAATARFVEWAGGDSSKILVLTWASEFGPPDHYFDRLESEIKRHTRSEVIHGVTLDEIAANRSALVHQIQSATGVYFTGGDQNLIMDALERDAGTFPNDPLAQLLRSRYAAGVVFGGTSAGTAIMSTPMLAGPADLTVIDGKTVGTRDGLGLVPGVIFDQHFLAHGRLPRLLGLVQLHPKKLGLGIDECTALLIEDSRFAEVVGCNQVIAIQSSGPYGKLELDPLDVGVRYDILTRTRL
jgi:cyanophycinase